MQVIATAGHVDHGKSTLVRALTGMEPDRWAEERRRGMTIDLGYAWTRLPSGEQVAFVDVPGHERFATNMLAGVGPVPAVLLVIAADEGWAAQTEEHVRALDALAVRDGVVAVTRSDLADPGTALDEVRERLAMTSLAGIPAVAVSGVTGLGLAGLRTALDELVLRLPVPPVDERVRLWVDRSFSIRGSGTVVTGTLRGGTIRRDDRLEVGGREVTVRGLQALGVDAEEVRGPARVAVNLRGVGHDEVRRGDALLAPGAWAPTRVVDVRAEASSLPSRVTVHVGSAATPAVVRQLGGGAARLQLLRPLPLQVGDRALLRDPGRRELVTGVVVLDPAPPALRLRGSAARRGVALSTHDGRPDLAREVATRGAVTAASLRAIGVPVPADVPASVVASAGWLVSRDTWDRWVAAVRLAVEGRPAATLLDTGIGVAVLARSAAVPDPRLVEALVAACPDLEMAGGHVRTRGASVTLRADLAAALEKLALPLRAEPFRAPEQPELAALGLGRRELGAAAAAGAILRLPGDVVLLPTAPQLAARLLREVPQPFTLSEARQALGTTRRVAVPLLEHLDGLRVTERVSEGLRRLRPG